MTGYIVCWMKESKKQRMNNVGPTYKDHYIPFIEFKDGKSPREQAFEFYKELLNKKRTYSANVCHVKDSTEVQYMHVEVPEGYVKK